MPQIKRNNFSKKLMLNWHDIHLFRSSILSYFRDITVDVFVF